MRNLKIKNNESGRSFLPICEVDAPLFLSAVYNKRYTSEKTTSRYPQSGRSMIEMLGVLAIIGVLSVGGIAGYSKAMQKYRINKTIEQITLIAGNVRTFFAPQRSYDGLTNTVIKKAKLVPDEMLTSRTEFEQEYDGMFSHMGVTDDSAGKAFSIVLHDIPQEACIEIATNDWPNEAFAVWIADDYMSWGSDNVNVYTGCTGTSTLSKTTGNYQACRAKGDLPLEVDKAVDACTCASDNLCDIRIAYK